ncbi:MAG: ABC transporter substrate-binding protein [Acetobacteraceae bacterium]|nr:ABC transporter substrate-binding protein [Acetobacteraceae bacterium]
MRHLLLAAGWLLALAGAASAQNFRIALREDPDSLDPTLARTYVSRIVFAGLCDKLFDINEKLEIVPQLATGYEWADPKTLVIKLRQGVVFHDGEKMDANAVKYSLERHLNMQGSFRRSEINVMDHVEVVDPATVKIVLKQPSSPFLAQLTDRAGMIVSPKAAEAAGKDFTLKPVCAGPFRFVERVPQDHITLERFPQYWDSDKIKLERVTYQTVPDSSIRLANLQAGSIDLSEYVIPTDVDAVKSNPKLKLATMDSLGFQTIEFNTANGPSANTPLGQDARVRRAFERAIDRQALVQVVYNGLYEPAAQGIPTESPMHVPAVKPQERDVEAAKALLKQAGVQTPVVVHLMVPNNPDLRQAGEIIQSMAAEAGFDVQITASEYASALDAANRGDFEAFVTAWSGRVDPDGNLYSFYHTGGGLNDAHYSNAQVDKLLEDARAVSDPAQRRDLYAKMLAQTTQDLPIMYLWFQKNIVGMSAKVQGFKQVPDGMIRLQGVSLAQ